jgi:hypothetical protein
MTLNFDQYLRPGQAGYNDARRIWNGMIDRRESLIERRRPLAWRLPAGRFLTQELQVLPWGADWVT